MSAASEEGQYTQSMADAQKKLADDLAAGYEKTSTEIKGDQQAIDDLKKKHHDAMMQMIVDMYQEQLAAAGTFDPQKVLDLELALGLLTTEEYNAAEQAMGLKAAIDSIPKNASAEFVMWYIT